MEQTKIKQYIINDSNSEEVREQIERTLDRDALYTVFSTKEEGIIPYKVLHCTFKHLLKLYDTAVKNKDNIFSYISE